MEIPFVKYQGTGNDFILIDNRQESFPKDDLSLISRMCHRKWGIGADGLMLIEQNGLEDFEMIFFNPDGTKSLCGNGSRCAVAFAQTLGLLVSETQFLTTDGQHHARVENQQIHFQIHDVRDIRQYTENDFFIFNGSPHHVRFVTDLTKVDITGEGRTLRNDPRYSPDGTNVNFVAITEKGIEVRTYERGVENETLSCGTGVVASALASSLKGVQSPITVETQGGSLTVTFTKGDTGFANIYLAGPAQKVFTGVYHIN